MAERKYYVFCEDKCLFEGMTKEQILTAIKQAVEEGEIHDIDTGFVSKILEQNGNAAVKLWIGTEAQFNELPTKADDTLYIFTTDFEEDIASEIEKIKDGTTVVKKAENAGNAGKVNNLEIKRVGNGVLKIDDTIIPQQKLLWSGYTRLDGHTSSTEINCGVVLYGKKIKLETNRGIFYSQLNTQSKHISDVGYDICYNVGRNADQTGIRISALKCGVETVLVDGKSLYLAISVFSNTTGQGADTIEIEKIYEIIE